MSSTKKRDLAQELVDFLLKEENSPKKEPSDEKKMQAEGALTNALNPSTVEMKTFVLPSEKSAPQEPVSPVFEFDLQLGEEGETSALATPPVAEPSKEKILVNSQVASSKARDPMTAGSRGRTVFTEVGHLLGGVEAIRVAQNRISSLEAERDGLRSETDKLLAACENLQLRVGELKAEQEKTELRHREKIEILEEEKVVFKTRLMAREDELLAVKRERDELQSRFQNDLRKIRVRERDLESRQELLKAESAAVVKSKDEMILELKRQLEKLQFEIDGFRGQSAELNSTIGDFYERNARTVKALRLALSILEVGDNDDRAKKVG